ncbi:hypothetical protein SCB49_10637 [unidentified eubacterium SCB49]|nr:hypothetical protein SCB49_10637 [unidentified eubacterium SCB49]
MCFWGVFSVKVSCKKKPILKIQSFFVIKQVIDEAKITLK